MDKLPCDGLIFDMDGTLWDAVDSYAEVWNRTLADCGVHRQPIRRDELIAMMGMHLEDIMAALLPGSDADSAFLDRVYYNEHLLMPVLGGRLYDGVRETLEKLHRRLPLFMVSNCGDSGLENFLNYTGLKPLFKAWLTHGGTGLPKADNIRALIDKYDLKHPVYVGDTVTDARAAHAVGAAMIWCTYGFGSLSPHDYERAIDRFSQLPDLVIPD